MIHKKKEHGENENDCWDFLAGKCELGDGLCWFKHDENINTSKNEYKICGKNFENLNNFMIHKKDEHTTTVQQCTNKKCFYGDKKCWFRHDMQTDNEKNIHEQNQEITEKILKMIETFTVRIVELEKKDKIATRILLKINEASGN